VDIPQFFIVSILVAPFLRNSCDGLNTGLKGVWGFDIYALSPSIRRYQLNINAQSTD
jgi:hypothetical protein